MTAEDETDAYSPAHGNGRIGSVTTTCARGPPVADKEDHPWGLFQGWGDQNAFLSLMQRLVRA